MIRPLSGPLEDLARTMSCNVFGSDALEELDQSCELVGLVCNGALLGFVVFGGELNGNPHEICVHCLAVDGAIRRQGHGRRLLEYVRQACIDRGIPEIIAVCHSEYVSFYCSL